MTAVSRWTLRRVDDGLLRAIRAGCLGMAFMLFLGGCQTEDPSLAATPDLLRQSPDAPYASVPQVLQTSDAQVIYVTDRARVGDRRRTEMASYSWMRSHAMAAGLCTVKFGEGMAWGQLVEQSTSERTRDVQLRVSAVREIVRFPDARDEPGDGWLRPKSPLHSEQWDKAQHTLHAMLRDQLAKTPRKELFIFVHGASCSLEDAAAMEAELWHFTGRQGVPVIYTWPAGRDGILRSYAYDRESSEFTGFHFRQFLRCVAACPEVNRISIIAHSRGADVVVSALRDMHLEYRAAGRDTRCELKLGNVILAAPDLDEDVAYQKVVAERLESAAERWTLYSSPHDGQIALSDWVFGSRRRMGQMGAADVSQSEIGLFGQSGEMDVVQVIANPTGDDHSYFVEDPAVLSDVILVLRDNRAPGAGYGRPLTSRGEHFWELPEGYLRSAPVVAAQRIAPEGQEARAHGH